MKFPRLAATAVAAAMLATANAHAASYDLTLSGDASETSSGSFDSGGMAYSTQTLVLTGFTPFTIQDGDTVNATVNISNGSFNLPSDQSEFLGLSYADTNGSNDDSSSTSNAGSFVINGQTLGTNCGNCTAAYYSTANQPITFNNLQSTSTFSLGGPFQISQIDLTTQTSHSSGGPEPSTWALMMVGVFGVGIALRRRQHEGFSGAVSA